MSRVSLFRFCVFWIWALTLLITVGVYIGLLIHDRTMKFPHISDSLTEVTGMILPQLSVMLGFFFGSDRDLQAKIVDDNRGMAGFALGLSLVYHACFWIVITLAIYFGLLGDRIDDNTSAAVKILGIFSLFGLTPVAYLFAGGGRSQPAPAPPPPAQPAQPNRD